MYVYLCMYIILNIYIYILNIFIYILGFDDDWKGLRVALISVAFDQKKVDIAKKDDVDGHDVESLLADIVSPSDVEPPVDDYVYKPPKKRQRVEKESKKNKVTPSLIYQSCTFNVTINSNAASSESASKACSINYGISQP